MRFATKMIAAPARVLRRLGDAASDLNTAGQALLSDLQTNGCQQSAQASVSTFQAAWNAAWVTPLVPAQIAVDGLYGSDTSSALQTWANQQGLGVTVPAGCVGTASSGGGGGTTTNTTNNTTNTTTTTTTAPGASPSPLSMASLTQNVMGVPAWLLLVGGGVAAVAYYEHTHGKAGKRRARRGRKLRALKRRRRR